MPRFPLFITRHALLLLFLMLTLALATMSDADLLSVARADNPQETTPPVPPPTTPRRPVMPEVTNEPPEKPAYLVYAWLGCSTLSFIVTWMLSQSGKMAASLQYSGDKTATSPAAGSKRKGAPPLTWRTFILPLVWLPLPCMFAVTALGADTPLVFEAKKTNKLSEVVGYSKNRNDPGWIASSNDMADLTGAITVCASYVAAGLISLNLGLLVLLSLQLFSGRDPQDETDATAPDTAVATTTGSDSTAPPPSQP